jgi:competence protein ComEA
MKLLLREDRASSAVLARSSSLARLGAWARESLLARALGVLLGLGALALIGGSAIAGGRATASSSPPATPSVSVPTSTAAADAGEVPTVRPESLPVAPSMEASESPASPATKGTSNRGTRATPDDPVDLNTAGIDDLRRLPGVGQKRAEAILALRARLPGGRFRQIEDLLKVKGVGRAMLKRLHPLVRIT